MANHYQRQHVSLACGWHREGYVSPERHNLILTLGLALFVLPYLTLASPAGYLADRFSKRQVILICKMAEIVVMALGIWAIYLGSLSCLWSWP